MQSNLVSSDSILMEINAVIGHAAEKGRDHLNAEEIDYVTRTTIRMVRETKMQLSEIPLLMPEEIPEEVVAMILRGAN